MREELSSFGRRAGDVRRRRRPVAVTWVLEPTRSRRPRNSRGCAWTRRATTIRQRLTPSPRSWLGWKAPPADSAGRQLGALGPHDRRPAVDVRRRRGASEPVRLDPGPGAVRHRARKTAASGIRVGEQTVRVEVETTEMEVDGVDGSARDHGSRSRLRLPGSAWGVKSLTCTNLGSVA